VVLRAAGARPTSSRYGLYLPPLELRPLLERAEGLERVASGLGRVGAAFFIVDAVR
jgi:hypothetical protein